MWIKVCGIRTIDAAREVADLGSDAVGLNFYAPSPRFVDAAAAAEIVRSLPENVEPVGLFVNESAQTVHETCQRCDINTVQLHGDERPQLLADLQQLRPDIRIIRAYRMGDDGLGPLAEYLAKCEALGVKLGACLVDARVAGVYGGSGRPVCWETLAKEYQRDDWPPLVLAGGLNPDNVAEAIQAVRPWGVDVASGVESAPGVKDVPLVDRFSKNARAAFDAIKDE